MWLRAIHNQPLLGIGESIRYSPNHFFSILVVGAIAKRFFDVAGNICFVLSNVYYNTHTIAVKYIF